MKLNIGCGRDIRAGYNNIDLYHVDPRVIKLDIEKLVDSYPENSVDEIVASDVIEHISHLKVRSVLKMWISVLKSGGLLYIKTPDIEKQIECVQNNTWNSAVLSNMIFGGQDSDGNYHKCAFKRQELINLLVEYGMDVQPIKFEHFRLTADIKHSANANMIVVSKKI